MGVRDGVEGGGRGMEEEGEGSDIVMGCEQLESKVK